jgi:hypothetical protein
MCIILFFLQPLHAQERGQISTRYCTIENTPGDRTALYLAKNADAIVESVSSRLGFAPGERIHVIVASDRKHFNSAQPPGARLPDWTAGTAYPQRGLIVLLKNSRGDILRTFEHEVCHILLGKAFGPDHRVPRWLHEGMAIIVAGEWSMQRLKTMTMAVLTGRLLPMEDITHAFPRDALQAEIAYCQSFYFISFLKSKFGEDDFRRFLKAYSSRKDFKLALRKAYFLYWEEIETLWLDYLKVRFSWFPILFSTGFLWFLASILFVWGYIHKKRTARVKLRQWGVEEQMSSEREETRH